MSYKTYITEEDYIKYNIFHLKNSKLGKRTILMTRIFIILVFAIGVSVITAICRGNLFLPIVCAIFLGIFSLVYIILTPKLIERSFKRTIKRQKLDGKLPFEPESEIEFLDDMIVKHNTFSDIRLPYTDIQNFVISPDCLYIYIDSSRAIIVPFKALGADLNQIISLINQKMNK